MKIYKYQLPTSKGVHQQMMNRIKKILHLEVVKREGVFDAVYDEVFMWALVDERVELNYEIAVFFTGDELYGDPNSHIGTAVTIQGQYVLHYFMSI